MSTAIYAGSFDPLTNGHLWIIEEASELFDNLIVAIGTNPDKRYTFSVEERLAHLKHVTQGLDNCTTAAFENKYLVTYASEMNARYIVRGIRNEADYGYEKTMRYINSDLNDDVTTVFLMPPKSYVEVSSSMVKGLVGPGGWEDTVKQYVPEIVFKSLCDHHYSQ